MIIPRDKLWLSLGLLVLLSTACQQQQSTKPASQPESKPPSSVTAQSSASPDNSRSSIDEQIVKAAGQRLSLDYAALLKDAGGETLKDAIDEAQVTPLASGHVLIGYAGGLYRLNQQGKTVWSYPGLMMLWSYTYVPATNLIYGTAADNVMFILDAATGKERYQISRNGSAGYGKTIPYGTDGCLIIEPRDEYRNRQPPGGILVMDKLEAWRGLKPLWEIEIPPEAEIAVVAGKIFATMKSDKAVYVKEIYPPK